MKRIDRDHPESVLLGLRTKLTDIVTGCIRFEICVIEHKAQVFFCHFADISHDYPLFARIRGVHFVLLFSFVL
jgi:hypothetical protein